jgi:PAS domain S-box-containing protein
MNSVAHMGDASLDISRPTALRSVLAAAGLYVLFYVLLDWLSFVQPVLKLGITPWSPQTGLTLAFLLLLGPRWASATALAALLAEVIIRGRSPVSLLAISLSVWIAVGYGFLATLLRRWNLAAPVRTSRAGVGLAAASLCVSLVVAVGYVLLVIAAGDLPRAQTISSIVRYWIGDLNGILTVTTLLMSARSWREGVRLSRERIWEVLAQCAAIGLTLWIIFGLTATDDLRAYYPLFVPVIWIALRWGVPGAMLATLGIQIALMLIARDETMAPPLMDLQLLMVILNATALLLGAVVTDRATALKRMAQSEARQRALLDMAPDAVLAIDSSGLVRSSNPAALKLFGDKAGVQAGGSAASLLPGLALTADEGHAALDACRQGGTRFPAEVAWARLDEPAGGGFLITVRDVSERRRAQEQLRERDTALARAMRFAVAGELASALAHELNQPMTAVVSYLRALAILTEEAAKHEPRIETTLSKVTHEAIRAAKVLRRLRDFYRGGASKKEAIDLPELCSAITSAFDERLRRAEVTLTISVAESPPQIEWDTTQFEIVLHNLIANSLDAVSHADKANRRIELSVESKDDAALVSVADSGPGLSAEVLKHLFEPFTTTKPDGMGLGLAISRSLIRARGGDLLLDPHGKLGGATFTLRIPTTDSR